MCTERNPPIDQLMEEGLDLDVLHFEGSKALELTDDTSLGWSRHGAFFKLHISLHLEEVEQGRN